VVIIVLARTREGVGVIVGRKLFHTDDTVSKPFLVGVLVWNHELVQLLGKVMGCITDFLNGSAHLLDVKIEVDRVQ